MADDDDRPPIGPGLADAERFSGVDDAGVRFELVVLACEVVDGVEFVLVADDAELRGPGDDMGLLVYRVVVREDGERDLGDVDGATEERMLDFFEERLGIR